MRLVLIIQAVLTWVLGGELREDHTDVFDDCPVEFREIYRVSSFRSRDAIVKELQDLGYFPKEWVEKHFAK